MEGFGTLKDNGGKILFSGLRVKTGISFGIPDLRRLVPSTGCASYQGAVVQRAAQLMVMACPGQVRRLGIDCYRHSLLFPAREPARMRGPTACVLRFSSFPPLRLCRAGS